MIAEKNKVVSFNYTLKDSDGNELDSSDEGEPLTYLHGAQNIIPGLEAAINEKAAGDSVTAVIAPEDAYGQRNEAQVSKVPRDKFEGIEGLQVGMALQAQTPDGARVVHVVGMDEESITIDANHPLAGVTLHFELTVTEVRDATEEEISHGHVGACDHQH